MANTPVMVDGVAMNRQHPRTFEIPSIEEKKAVPVGGHVKIGVATNAKRAAPYERFWVLVTANNTETGVVTGTVDNDLLFTKGHGLKYGDEVTIPYNYVISID